MFTAAECSSAGRRFCQ